MMNSNPKPKAWQFLFIIIVLCGIIYLVWLGLSEFIGLFKSLESEVAAAIVAASATIIVAVASIIVGKYYERKMAVEQEHRNKKIPVYEEFIEFLFKMLMSNKLGENRMTEEEMLKFFIVFTQKLLVWGSDEVVQQWSRYRRLMINNEMNGTNNMFELEKLLLAIRKDTGHKNKSTKKGDILGLFINDIDRHINEV